MIREGIEADNPNPVRVKLESLFLFFIFLIYVGCPGQLTRTTTIPHGPLDILQAQEQIRHHGDDKRAHKGSRRAHRITILLAPESEDWEK